MNLDKLRSLHFRQNEGFALCSHPDVNEDATKLNTDADDQNSTSSSADHHHGHPSPKLVEEAAEFCKNSRQQNSRCKVFVGNVSYKVKSYELNNFFSYFGQVINAQIVRDRIKKRSRGFGYVVFSSEWDAQRAIYSSDQERQLDGRVMAVKVLDKAKKKGYGKTRGFEDEESESLQHAAQYFAEKYKRESECAVVCNEDMPPEDTSTDHRSISSLNDDTVLHIFNQLGLKDLIRIERVCKRWQQLAIKSWQFVHHLDFHGVFKSFKGFGGLTDDILWSIVNKGRFLRSLDLSASPSLLTEFSVHIIGKYCKGLQRVDLSGVTVTTSSLRSLSKQCPKLESVKLKGCHKFGEKGLWWLFKQCRKLKNIDISGNKRLSGQCFFMLPETCESLDMRECVKVTDAGFSYVGNRCPNLKSINVSECTFITDEGLLGLAEDCRQLETLQLSGLGSEVTRRGLNAIGNLMQLGVLDLSSNAAVDDDVLFTIGSSCIHLRVLNISRCRGDITDAGMQCLASCYQLSDLCINRLEQITDESVKHLAANATMQKFMARLCPSITDQAVITLIRDCPDLRELDVCGCDRITDLSLEYLYQYSTTERHCAMELDIGGTSVTLEAAETARTATTWCRVVTEDFSVKSLWGEREPRIEFGIMLPDWDEEEEEEKVQENGFEGVAHHVYDNEDAEDFLVAWDPSMYSDEEWIL